MAAKPALLAGGNPQIAKADGDAPVQAYIAAMPGWKRDVGRRLDALIVRTVPDVRKAIKWNSPFYGIEGQGWFLNFHCFTKYVKVAFFRGTSLRPLPPGESKHKEVRYLDIHEDDQLDEEQLANVDPAGRRPARLGPVATVLQMKYVWNFTSPPSRHSFARGIVKTGGLACHDDAARSVAGRGRSCRSDQEPSLTIRPASSPITGP